MWVWVCVKVVNSAGARVRKARCRISRIGFSVVVVGWGGGWEEIRCVLFVVRVECGMRVGGCPPPRRLMLGCMGGGKLRVV